MNAVCTKTRGRAVLHTRDDRRHYSSAIIQSDPFTRKVTTAPPFTGEYVRNSEAVVLRAGVDYTIAQK